MKLLTSQVAKLERRIGELEMERSELAGKLNAGPKGLHDEVFDALQKAIASLETAKQGRQDRLSYYDGMLEPEDNGLSTRNGSSGHESVGSVDNRHGSAAVEPV